MNLDGIKYIFQIPLVWFKRVGEFVFRSYGGNLVQIRRDRNGAAEIFVDPDELKDQATSLLNGVFWKPSGNTSGVVRNANGVISYINNSQSSQTLTVVTDVIWTGVKLQKKTKDVTIQYGIITSISAESTADIDTAVTYNPS